jgi:CubicO group peptidase (beta-lactamase class C family)
MLLNKYDKRLLVDYIKALKCNQEYTNAQELKNLCSTDNYLNLLEPVIKCIHENPNSNGASLRLKLLEQSKLKEKISDFVFKTQITPGIVLEYGTEHYKDTIVLGNRQEYTMKNDILIKDALPMTYDTIFDLASTSKLFTSLAIYKCVDENLIDLYRPITEYLPEFQHLNNVTVFELLTFSKRVITRSRIDAAKNINEAYASLLSAYPDPNQNLHNAYTDIGAMILRLLIERVTKVRFDEFVQATIFDKANMVDTHLNVPDEKKNRCINENYSTNILKDGTEITKSDTYPGTVHDPKARIIGHHLGIAPGHAGYFSTTPDMMRLATSLKDKQIISQKSLYEMSNNVVGKVNVLENGKKDYSFYYGSLVYLKQPDPHHLSCYPPLSGKSFLSPGYAGTVFCLDPINNISLFMGSNRLHNRIPEFPDALKNQIIKDEFGKMTYKLKNGQEKILSTRFAAEREQILQAALNLSIQYQFLEILKDEKKELHLVREV